MSGKFALIIGNTEYADPGLAQLTAPGRDAADFARVLEDQEIGAFDEVSILMNEPEYVVREAIDDFFNNKKPDDLLVLYFSGHGVRDELGALYLAVKNTSRSKLRATGIKSDYIREAMDQSRSRRQVLILDCCNSGAFAQGTKSATGVSIGTASAFEGGYGRIILTASDSTQFAWEGDKVIGETDNSLFTHFLVEGLEGKADLDSDGRITVDELYDYAYEKVRLATPKQTPSKFSSKQQGEIVLRQKMRIEDIKPLPLPDELIEEIEDTRPYVREAAVQKLEKILKGKNIGLTRSAREALEKIVADENTTRRVAQAATQVLESFRLVEQKAEEERRAREEAERLAILKAEEERLAHEKAEAERKAKEEAERLLKAQAEHEAAEKAEWKAAEKANREKAERELAEKAEREAIKLAARKKAEREAKEFDVVIESKAARTSWLTFGMIGAACIVLALLGYGATRLASSMFGGGASAPTQQPATQTSVTRVPAIQTTAIETTIPSKTPATLTLTFTKEAPPTKVPLITPTIYLASTPNPFIIGKENANQVKEIARWGIGHVDPGWYDEAAFSIDGKSVVYADNKSYETGNTISLWNLTDGGLIRKLENTALMSTDVDISPNGVTVASSFWGKLDITGRISLWNVSDGTLLRIMNKGSNGNANGFESIAFSPDGQTLASGSFDEVIRLWDVSDGSLLRTFEGGGWNEYGVVFSPDGQILAAASQTVCLWRVNDGALIKTLGGNEYYRSTAFSPDGQMLAAGSLDGNIQLWRVSDGNLLQTLKGAGYILSINFSPDSKIIASGGEDASIRLWDVSNGQLLSTLRGHSGPIIALAFSPDSTILASVSNDGTLRKWGIKP